MEKEKIYVKPTEKQREQYENAKQKLIKNAEYNVFPSPVEYEMFYQQYYALFGQYFPRCAVCHKPLTPEYPTIFEPYIDLNKCATSKYSDNCYVLASVGLRKRCGTVEVMHDEVTAGDAYEMTNGTLCIGPWGKCKDFEDSHSKSIILENFVSNIGVRMNKHFCSNRCKKQHQNQVYGERYPEKKRLSAQRYIDGLVEDELRNRTSNKK